MESRLPFREYERIAETVPEIEHEQPQARRRNKDARDERRKQRLLIPVQPHLPEKDGQQDNTRRPVGNCQAGKQRRRQIPASLQDKKKRSGQEQFQRLGISGRQQDRSRKKAEQCSRGESELITELLANQLEKNDDSQQSRDVRHQQQCIRSREAATRSEAPSEHRIQWVKYDVLLNRRVAAVLISLCGDLEIPLRVPLQQLVVPKRSRRPDIGRDGHIFLREDQSERDNHARTQEYQDRPKIGKAGMTLPVRIPHLMSILYAGGGQPYSCSKIMNLH